MLRGLPKNLVKLGILIFEFAFMSPSLVLTYLGVTVAERSKGKISSQVTLSLSKAYSDEHL